MSDPVVDIRDEPCGMPVLRVERFLLEKSGRGAFSVLGDHEQTMDQLRLLAQRHGWTCDVRRESGSDWIATFRPPTT
jgi:TusA-related sulfurtransferase